MSRYISTVISTTRSAKKYLRTHCSILGLYRGNGKQNGNYYSILGLYRGNIGIMENKMEMASPMNFFYACKPTPRTQEETFCHPCNCNKASIHCGPHRTPTSKLQPLARDNRVVDCLKKSWPEGAFAKKRLYSSCRRPRINRTYSTIAFA